MNMPLLACALMLAFVRVSAAGGESGPTRTEEALIVAADAEGAGGRITVSGSAEERMPAEWLAVQFESFAAGRDAASASQKLGALEQRLRKSFVKLGATADSIQIGPRMEPNHLLEVPTLAPPLSAALPGTFGAPQTDSPKRLSTDRQQLRLASTIVNAKFALPVGDVEAAIAKEAAIEKAITSEDLAGTKALLAAACTHCAAGLGKPSFGYSARVKREDRLHAMRRAFEQAKQDAQDLAEMAHASLGGIVELSRPERNLGGPPASIRLKELPALPGLPPLPSLRGMPSLGRLDKQDKSFATGDRPGSVTYMESVRVVFRLRFSAAESPD